MDPVTLAAVTGGIGVVGGILGDQAAAGDRRRASRAFEDIGKNINNLTVPDIKQLQYTPAEIAQASDITAPDLYIPETGVNAYEDISVDPNLAAAQMQAMGSMDQIIEGGGLTDMDRLNAARAQQASQMNATQQGMDIQQDMARRGMGGSGQELLAKLAGSQGSVNRAAEQEQALQAQARDRALSAIMNKGGMATEFRGQQSAEDQAKANAANAVNQFNISGATAQQNFANQQKMQADIVNQAKTQGVFTNNANNQTIANSSNANAYGERFGYNKDKVGLQTDYGKDKVAGLNAKADGTAKKYTEGADFISSLAQKKYGQPESSTTKKGG